MRSNCCVYRLHGSQRGLGDVYDDLGSPDRGRERRGEPSGLGRLCVCAAFAEVEHEAAERLLQRAYLRMPGDKHILQQDRDCVGLARSLHSADESRERGVLRLFVSGMEQACVLQTAHRVDINAWIVRIT